MSGRREYAFGDDEGAARRLADLARLYEPTSAAFLTAHAPQGPPLALDLGCGPGHTTRLVAETLRSGRTIGVDESAAFVDQARQGAPPGVEYLRHDVRQLPLPVPPADVVYARFLLAHLPRPADVARLWTGLLAEGGVLLLEDTEHMESTNSVCTRYLDLVQATLAAEGRELFAGRRLAQLEAEDGYAVRHSGAVEVRQPARRYAALFAPNLRQWGDRALELGVAGEMELRRLATGLDGMATGDAHGTVTAVLRQVVLARDTRGRDGDDGVQSGRRALG